MILSIALPKIGDHLLGASVHRILVEPGQDLRPGSPLVEVRADLGAGGEQDCPPIQFFRIVATERARLERLVVAVGDALVPGAALGIAATAPTDDAEAAPTRALRTMSVAIRVDPLSD